MQSNSYIPPYSINGTPYSDQKEPPECYIYISHLDEDYQYWILPSYPDEISDTMQSTFAQTNALGRTAPVFTFSYSGPRTVQISLDLHRDIMDDVNLNISNTKLGQGEDYVDSLIRALQSIALPKYNLTDRAIEPPMVAVKLGEELFIKGVVTSGIGISYEKPILEYSNKYARVRLSLTISEIDPYDSQTVFTNGHYRGEVSTLRQGAIDHLNKQIGNTGLSGGYGASGGGTQNIKN